MKFLGVWCTYARACVALDIAQSDERPHAQKMAGRRTSVDHLSSKKRRTGIDPAWSDDFPWMLCKLAAIGLLLPMSTVDCERGFSALSRIKTDIRNRLSSKVLNHLVTISVEGLPPEEFPYDKACDLWASWRNRRIDVTA